MNHTNSSACNAQPTALLAHIRAWIAQKDKGQKYACVRDYRNDFDPLCEGCLAKAVIAQIELLTSRLKMIADAAKDGASLTWIRAVAEEGLRGEPLVELRTDEQVAKESV